MSNQKYSSLGRRFKLGLVINSYAGLGGPTALKGSDGTSIRTQALASTSELRAPERARRALAALVGEPVDVYCFAGEMGASIAHAAGLAVNILGEPKTSPSEAADTVAAAKACEAAGCDLILFVGGDGTARNMVEAVSPHQPVLGLPSGVKMHSGVYAIAPEAAALVIKQLISGALVALDMGEVRDIDEQAFREGHVQSRYYGELLVPAEPRYVQAVKEGGREVEALALDDIAAELTESVSADTLLVFAPGSTTFAVAQAFGVAPTLLGVDLVLNNTLVAADADAQTLEAHVFNHSGPVKLVLTAIGGQGHIFGRGNQQLRPALLRHIGRDNLLLVATKTKLAALNGRPLLIDTNDAELDHQWQGYIKVITGYRDAVLYPLGYAALNNPEADLQAKPDHEDVQNHE
ncbi:NAD(+)/NADH kinase [Simiduia sp. 21SJ11W-1]|uniref:ATP-NAD kinase family protein n=1 Tax=Simiduia sp. 21SJ11W-1 TaxID=2909669 RepID=UPI0020A0AC0C|nr:NAD(+)/NADH kinase [Simiduia sp. 21SJ11W-1]UTA46566.1 NAD(+)/NADH kinase [Simiduia sp. 21SJ11W-1]